VDDALQRTRGVGADVIIRPPNSSLFSFSSTFTEGILKVASARPEAAMATGTLIYPIGGVDSVTGIDLAAFNQMSGGFHYLEGGPVDKPDDILVDRYYAQANHYRAGDTIEVMNRKWHLARVVEEGKMSRMFVHLPHLQELIANTSRLSCIYIKLTDPAQTNAVRDALKPQLEGYRIYSIQDLISQMPVTNVPMLRKFTGW
jgi:putative ABC transport system permease protein